MSDPETSPSFTTAGFAHRELAGNEGLTGCDVIVIHRLAKKSAAEVLGTKGYALLTDACMAAMAMTTELVRGDGGTTVQVRGEPLAGERLAAWEQVSEFVLTSIDASLGRLSEELAKLSSPAAAPS